MSVFALWARDIFSLLSCRTYNLEIWSKSHYALKRAFSTFQLHLVDGFDEVEEGFGALGLVGDFASGVIGGF